MCVLMYIMYIAKKKCIYIYTLWLESAICFNPIDKLFNLVGVNDNRDNNGLDTPDFVASSKSNAFASNICDCLVNNNSDN